MKWYSEENLEKITNFKKELFELYDKYQLAIEHEDGGGAFEVYTLTINNKEWMEDSIETEISRIENVLNKDIEFK